MATHSSTLAWKIPWTEEPGRLQSTGSLRVGHDWETSLSLFTSMHWRRKWQPTPVFLLVECCFLIVFSRVGEGALVPFLFLVGSQPFRLESWLYILIHPYHLFSKYSPITWVLGPQHMNYQGVVEWAQSISDFNNPLWFYILLKCVSLYLCIWTLWVSFLFHQLFT